MLFSFNGIDSQAHEDRIKALKEIHRVLKPGGFFIFSTHNRECLQFNKFPWDEKRRLTPGYLKSCLHSLFYLPRHLKMRRHQRHTALYAIINDNAHGYSLLTYYISIEEQIKQLESLGFKYIEAYDTEGVPVNITSPSPWLYYLAKK